MSIAESGGGNGRPTWFTSSYSNGAGGECVECAVSDKLVLIRDSKSSEGRCMPVASSAWQPFVHALKQGKLDRA
ncbi:DUF397 domain-containing protein [Streptomyces neyagawaensis]|uniref:DUF397 domain-containing protein n=1 Tax=Streptomyces neyagawaensis TaxID=42238 RepID=UPI00099EA6B7|nr:DUF397 domain-containing protein [Streptomyces neyagawaensis]MCL6738376.1 DUF397 domain-containing protein [Streptomyces neyagawaensis]MDE1684510.1 DUF397 domain-containing protein [Streptomyces neyagawaensis]